jgi:hypothetical protein
MTYRLIMLVRNQHNSVTPRREVTTKIAGCDNEEHARQKARELYDVVTIKKIEVIPQ